MQMTAEAHEHKGNQEDHEYDVFLEKCNQRVAELIADGRRLFLTDIEPFKLWSTYMAQSNRLCGTKTSRRRATSMP